MARRARADSGRGAPLYRRRYRPGEGSVHALRRQCGAATRAHEVSTGLGIVLPALIAGLLVTATHVPLGIQVLRRGIVFIDLAVAQIAGLGVIVADRLGYEPQGVAVKIAALAAAL